MLQSSISAHTKVEAKSHASEGQDGMAESPLHAVQPDFAIATAIGIIVSQIFEYPAIQSIFTSCHCCISRITTTELAPLRERQPLCRERSQGAPVWQGCPHFTSLHCIPTHSQVKATRPVDKPCFGYQQGFVKGSSMETLNPWQFQILLMLKLSAYSLVVLLVLLEE